MRAGMVQPATCTTPTILMAHGKSRRLKRLAERRAKHKPKGPTSGAVEIVILSTRSSPMSNVEALAPRANNPCHALRLKRPPKNSRRRASKRWARGIISSVRKTSIAWIKKLRTTVLSFCRKAPAPSKKRSLHSRAKKNKYVDTEAQHRGKVSSDEGDSTDDDRSSAPWIVGDDENDGPSTSSAVYARSLSVPAGASLRQLRMHK
ncbi:hypothetical protein V8E36_007018 [Tilletia maclaganii]